VEELLRVGFHYITPMAKPQIEVPLDAGVFQMELFAAEVCEIQQAGAVRAGVQSPPGRTTRRFPAGQTGAGRAAARGAEPLSRQ
jgi:hypothetical protein